MGFLREMALMATISETMVPGPMEETSRRIGLSVIPAMGAKKTLLSKPLKNLLISYNQNCG